jgi:hypothetical protein
MKTKKEVEEALRDALTAIRARTEALKQLGSMTDLKPGVASAEAEAIRHATTAALATAREDLRALTAEKIAQARLALAQAEPIPTDEGKLLRYTNSADSKLAAEQRLMPRAERAYRDGNYQEARLLAMAAEVHEATGSGRLRAACEGLLDSRDPYKAPSIKARNQAIVEQAVTMREIDAHEVAILRELGIAASAAGDPVTATSVRSKAASVSAGAKVAAAVQSWESGEPYAGPDAQVPA